MVVTLHGNRSGPRGKPGAGHGGGRPCKGLNSPCFSAHYNLRVRAR